MRDYRTAGRAGSTKSEAWFGFRASCFGFPLQRTLRQHPRRQAHVAGGLLHFGVHHLGGLLLGGGVLLLPLLIFGLKFPPMLTVGLDALFNFMTKVGFSWAHLKNVAVRRGSCPSSLAS